MRDMRLMCVPRGKESSEAKCKKSGDSSQETVVRRQELGARNQEVGVGSLEPGGRKARISPFPAGFFPVVCAPWPACPGHPRLGVVGLAIAGLLLTSCGRPPEKVIDIQLFQQWQLQPGDVVAGRRLLGGLGDLSIDIKGKPIYAPFNGKVQPTTKVGCVVFSSPEVPAYSFRLCGLDHPKTGALQRGEEIGSGDVLQFAALRKQPNGKWAIVEPSQTILARTLSQS